jgi:hypothetical protein
MGSSFDCAICLACDHTLFDSYLCVATLDWCKVCFHGMLFGFSIITDMAYDRLTVFNLTKKEPKKLIKLFHLIALS